jgi:CubicO group peptidase (beta-lactamase class C family)
MRVPIHAEVARLPRPSRLAACVVAVVSLLSVGSFAPTSAAAPSPSADDRRLGLVGWPSMPDLVIDRVGLVLDPEYWVNYARELLLDGVVTAPVPIDPVKPETVLPTARVAPGEYTSTLPRRPRDLRGVTYDWRGHEKTLGEFVRTTETDGVTFVHRGRIVGDYYANGWSAGLRHQPWSVTKSFTSTLVGIALDEGRIEALREPIDAYVVQLRGTAWQGTTIENILQMESGIQWDEENLFLPMNNQVMQWVQMGLDLYTDGAVGMTRNEYLASLPRVEPQGTTFHYNSGNTQVLAWLLETVYGKPFHRILQAKLWQPAGMAGDALVMTDRVGDAVASQGLYARSHDFARLGELFRNGGVTPEGRRVVSARWIRLATTFTDVSDGQYGYQWWHGATRDGYSAVGFQGNRITVAPGRCLTGVRLSHTLAADVSPGDGDPLDPATYGFEYVDGGAEWDAVFRAVARHLGGCD